MESRLHVPAFHKQLGLVMTTNVILTRLPSAAFERDVTLTMNNTGDRTFYVWNTTMKTVENCSRFHRANESRYYYDWPEDMPHFHYCCTSYGKTNLTLNQHNLQDYVYSRNGQDFQLAEYYDLQVMVDPCLPYWKCWHYEALDVTNILTFILRCEVRDLRRFYNDRLWKAAIGRSGIHMSALPLIVSLEVGVLLATLALSFWRSFVKSPWERIFKLWLSGLKLVKFRIWLHLTLLAVVGNCFIEAIVLTDVYSWESAMLNNFAFIYLLLPIGVWIADFLQQVTDWRLVDVCIAKFKFKYEDIKEKLRHEFNNDDWRWQPIFLQLTTLSMLILYITYGSGAARKEFVALLLGVASVGISWSFIVAVILLFRKSILLAKSFKSSFVVSKKYRIVKDSHGNYRLESDQA